MLQKFYICTLKYPPGSPFEGKTYEGSPIPEEVFNSPTFRKEFETKIKKARMIPFDSEEYRRITGLSKEVVDTLMPKPQAPVKEAKVEKFNFDKVEIPKDNSTEKLPPPKEVKKRGRKPGVKV